MNQRKVAGLCSASGMDLNKLLLVFSPILPKNPVLMQGLLPFASRTPDPDTRNESLAEQCGPHTPPFLPNALSRGLFL